MGALEAEARLGLRALPLALLCLAAYSLAFQWAFFPPRRWGAQTLHFMLQGLGIAAAAGGLKGGWRGALAWAPAGLVAGAAAGLFNWVYNWEQVLAKASFWVLEWTDPASSVRRTWQLQQALRMLALGLPLALYAAGRGGGRWASLPLLVLACVASAVVRAQVVGSPLAQGQALGHGSWMLAAFWLLVFALGRETLDERTRQRV